MVPFVVGFGLLAVRSIRLISQCVNLSQVYPKLPALPHRVQARFKTNYSPIRRRGVGRAGQGSRYDFITYSSNQAAASSFPVAFRRFSNGATVFVSQKTVLPVCA